MCLLYTRTGLLDSTTEFINCVAILLVQSVRENWGNYGVFHVQ